MEVRDRTLTLVPVIMCTNNTLPAAFLRAAIIPLTLWGGDPIPCLAAGTPHGIIMIQSLSRVWFPQGRFILPTEVTSRKEQKAASHTDSSVFMKARLCWANVGPKSQNWTHRETNKNFHKWLFYSDMRGWKGHLVGQSEALAQSSHPCGAEQQQQNLSSILMSQQTISSLLLLPDLLHQSPEERTLNKVSDD